MVWHDGPAFLAPSDLVGYRVQIVTDNLVHLGLIPPMVHLFVTPSSGGEEENLREVVDGWTEPFHTMRTLQYVPVSDRYCRHLVGELLPHTEQLVKLRSDGYSRASAGGSGGAMCAFALSWTSPCEFSRAQMWVPGVPHSRTYSDFVRQEPKRNIRVWLSGGSNDLDYGGRGHPAIFLPGGLPIHSVLLANALKGRDYDFHFRFGDGSHGNGQGALDLPDSLAWLWRDYDPDRTEQAFEQELEERDKPLFRVGIVNRDGRV
jgi:enterochelin esterase family protein